MNKKRQFEQLSYSHYCIRMILEWK